MMNINDNIVVARLRECSAEINRLGLVALADEINRWLNYRIGSNISTVAVEHFSQQTSADLAKNVYCANAKLIIKEDKNDRLVKVLALADKYVNKLGGAGSTKIKRRIEEAADLIE